MWNMKVTHAKKENASSNNNKKKCMYSTWLKIDLVSADEGRNSDTSMLLVTTLEMILRGWKKNIMSIFHMLIYFVALLMSLSIF